MTPFFYVCKVGQFTKDGLLRQAREEKSIQPALYAFQHSANYSASMIIMGAILLTRYPLQNLVMPFSE